MGYYFTDKSSETGSGFTNYFKKRASNRRASKKYAKSIGAKVKIYDNFSGQVVGFRFTPDSKGVWNIKTEREYMAPDGFRFGKQHSFWRPRLTTKAGKELAKEINSLPFTTRQDLYSVIGAKDNATDGICEIREVDLGYLFQTTAFNKCVQPDDCTEVLKSEYYRLQGE